MSKKQVEQENGCKKHQVPYIQENQQKNYIEWSVLSMFLISIIHSVTINQEAELFIYLIFSGTRIINFLQEVFHQFQISIIKNSQLIPIPLRVQWLLQFLEYSTACPLIWPRKLFQSSYPHKHFIVRFTQHCLADKSVLHALVARISHSPVKPAETRFWLRRALWHPH